MLRYLHDVFGTGPTHMHCYLRMFQELDAHSVFHILPSLQHPSACGDRLTVATLVSPRVATCSRLPGCFAQPL